jgi:hypothetical protein
VLFLTGSYAPPHRTAGLHLLRDWHIDLKPEKPAVKAKPGKKTSRKSR